MWLNARACQDLYVTLSLGLAAEMSWRQLTLGPSDMVEASGSFSQKPPAPKAPHLNPIEQGGAGGLVDLVAWDGTVGLFSLNLSRAGAALVCSQTQGRC